jgi:hypothetical protein
MPDEAVTPENIAPEVDATPTEDATPDPEGAEALGDPGKKALDAMKAKWKAAEKRATEAAQRAADLEAMQNKTAEERAEFQRQREVEQAVLAKVQKMAARNGLLAAAKGEMIDPSDVLVYIDPAAVVVNEDGEVENADALVADLLARTSHLAAAQRGGKVGGSADAGARKTPPPVSIDEQIAEATAKGDYRTVIHLQTTKLAAAG